MQCLGHLGRSIYYLSEILIELGACILSGHHRPREHR